MYLVKYADDNSISWRTNVIFREQLSNSCTHSNNSIQLSPDEAPDAGEEEIMEPQKLAQKV